MDKRSRIINLSKKVNSNKIGTSVVDLSRNEIFQNVSTVFSGNVLSNIIGFLTTLILVRYLRPGEYGIFSVLDMIAGFSAGVLTIGFNWSMIKSVAAHEHEPSKAWYIAKTVLKVEIIYGFILAICLFWVASSLAYNFFHKPELLPYLKLCSVGVMGFILFQYRSSIFQSFKQFKLDAVYNVSSKAIYLLIILILLPTGLFNIQTISVIYVSLPLLISGYALFYLKNNFSRGKESNLSSFLPSFGSKYSLLLCYTICQWLAGQVHMIILTRYFPLQEIGLYGFAYKIYGFSLMLMTAINIVLLPTFSGISSKSILKDHFKKIFKTTSVVSICFFASVPFIGLFVRLFAGVNYTESTTMLQILIFGSATSTMLSPPVNILFALDKFKLIALGGFVMIIVNLIGHFSITRRFGGNGAALVQVLSHLILNGYFTFNVYRLLYLEKKA